MPGVNGYFRRWPAAPKQQGQLVFNIFASLAEFERELIREGTQAGLKAAGFLQPT
jgi:hypothetical protein